MGLLAGGLPSLRQQAKVFHEPRFSAARNDPLRRSVQKLVYKLFFAEPGPTAQVAAMSDAPPLKADAIPATA